MAPGSYVTLLRILLSVLILVGHGMSAPGVRHSHGRPVHAHGGTDWVSSHHHDHDDDHHHDGDHDSPEGPLLSDSVAHVHGILFGIPVSFPSAGDHEGKGAANLLRVAGEPWFLPTLDAGGLSAPPPDKPPPPCAWLFCPELRPPVLQPSGTARHEPPSSGPSAGFAGRTPILRC